MVFAGIYTAEGEDYTLLRDALEKLQLNDASLSYGPETSQALGFGFRCGFLGLFHMDIIQERLEREYDLDILFTAPSVEYQVVDRSGEVTAIDSPAELPPEIEIEEIREPWMEISIFTPADYIGPIMELVTGYASLDYTFDGYRPADLVKLDVLVAGQPVDALSIIVHRSEAYHKGQRLVSRMKQVIPRQQFPVAIQAAVGKRVISRANVKALRKDVLAKCYGGDVTRKRKLLEKQKKGKKRMKTIGQVQIPQEAFMTVLRLGDET
jgi:GTP-binding protein LepA